MAGNHLPLQRRIELAEAIIELAMARHASIAPRGFDSVKQRAKIHEQIDAMLDELAWLKVQVVIEACS